MPTVLLLDVSMSMSRMIPVTATSSPAAEPCSYRQLAIRAINSFLDHLATNNKLEFVSLVIFSSLYEQLVPFTRDYMEIRNMLGKLEEYNKTCIGTALRGISSLVAEEWGTSVQCQVILITDGNVSGMDRSWDHANGHLSMVATRLGFRLHVVCMAAPGDPVLALSEPVYQRFIADAAHGGRLYIPDGPPTERTIQQIFTTICDSHYTVFTGVIRCGNLRCPISIFPAPENYDRQREFEHVQKTVSKELEICGFLDIRDISNPPYISRHLVLPLPPTSSPSKSDTAATEVKADSTVDAADDKEADKSAAFTVLLHGSLKVEQMVALVQIGEDWYGMMYSYADSKKKSNLMLSIFEPGDNSLPWLGKFSQMAPASEFVTPPYGSDETNDVRSPFPIIPADKRSYTQNCVVWIKNTGLQADIQKILRTAKRLPEKLQHFYKELNRLRSAVLALGFYELLEAIALLLERECTLLPGQAHPDAAIQMSHAANVLRHPVNGRDASQPVLPVRTNFANPTGVA
jgi:hypothetical protein